MGCSVVGLGTAAAGAVLADREAELSALTEDTARLAARYQSGQRLLSDTQATLARAEGEAARAACRQKPIRARQAATRPSPRRRRQGSPG